MSNTPINLFNPKLITLEPSTFYESKPYGVTTFVTKLGLHNTSDLPVKVSIYIVPNNEQPMPQHQVFCKKIAGNDSFNVISAVGSALANGTKLMAMADVENVVTFHGAGIDRL